MSFGLYLGIGLSVSCFENVVCSCLVLFGSCVCISTILLLLQAYFLVELGTFVLLSSWTPSALLEPTFIFRHIYSFSRSGEGKTKRLGMKGCVSFILSFEDNLMLFDALVKYSINHIVSAFCL